MLVVVEKVRDERTGKKVGYKFASRFYQWGIGRTMPLNVLGGVLAAYNGGFYDGIHLENILPECKNVSVGESAPNWKEIKNRVCDWTNNNGAIIVQLDNTFDPKTWERTHKLNISFMIGSEDAYDTKWKTGDELTLKEWLMLKCNLRFMGRDVRAFFRHACETLNSFSNFDVKYGFVNRVSF